jgi:aminoglycoside 3-N-acetyltransferase
VVSNDLAKNFALNKNAVRSNHPVASFVAMGRKAEWLMDNHDLNSMFGFKSPLHKLYAQGAKVLCLGVNYETVTALHLMEYLSGSRSVKKHEAVISKNGERSLVEFEDLALNSKVFNEIGEMYEQAKKVTKSKIGSLEMTLLDYQEIVDFGAQKLHA